MALCAKIRKRFGSKQTNRIKEVVEEEEEEGEDQAAADSSKGFNMNGLLAIATASISAFLFCCFSLCAECGSVAGAGRQEQGMMGGSA